MDDLLEIGGTGGIKPIEEGSSSYYEYITGQQRKKQAVKFKIGEILQARIERVISETEAIISLPSGIYNCYLKGNLKAGDSLFLIVEKTDPVLELKIYAISVISDNVKIDLLQAIRILYLPDNLFYRELIGLYLENKNLIIRDELLDIHRAFLKINEKIRQNFELDIIIRTLFYMKECDFPLDNEIFANSFHNFYDLKVINENFKYLLNHLDQLPLRINLKFKKMIEIIKKFKNKNYIKIRLVNTIAKNLIEENIVMLLINDIINIKDRLDLDLFHSAEFLSKVIQSQQFWNKLSLKYGGFLNAFILCEIENEIEFSRLILLKSNPARTYYLMPGSEPMSKSMIPTSNELIPNLRDVSKESRADLVKYFDGLQSLFNEKGLAIISLAIKEDKISLPLRKLTSTGKGGQNLSFVV